MHALLDKSSKELPKSRITSNSYAGKFARIAKCRWRCIAESDELLSAFLELEAMLL
jgi:hypothetical protein